MILTPAIIALMMGLVIAVVMTVYSSTIGIRILRDWDISSGSESQLELERKTYLISTILAYVMGFELFSLFLFVYTVDSIHGLFVGAMCAAGSLNVNGYGYSALLVKMLVFCLCGLWLILNHTDNQAADYPLIRRKYRFLLTITGLILLESFLVFHYFAGMQPQVITSCCGALFSGKAGGLAGDMAAMPPLVAKTLFYLSVVLTVRSGVHTYATGRGARVFGWLSLWLLLFSLVSIVSFISVHFYELPTHHCPFCLLQKEYGYVGYPLYLSLFGAGIAGTGAAMLDRFRSVASLAEVVPRVQKHLCLTAIVGFVLFAAIASYPLLFSDFILEG
ncbi:MAG: hypothetical protein ACLGPL_11370 [Acidobacteriota bacterium]